MVLGETDMTLGEVIALDADSVVQLGKPSGEPIDIYVENQMLGKGEVIVLHDKVRVRVLEITRPSRERFEQETRRPEENV
jgi:flagellar motor switch protein FliN/FliY